MQYVTMRELPPLYRVGCGKSLKETWAELEMPGYAPTFTLTMLLQDNDNLPYPGLMVILPGVDERASMPFEDLKLPMPLMWAGQLPAISHGYYVSSVENYIDETLRKWGEITAHALRLMFPNGFDEDLLDDDDEDDDEDLDPFALIQQLKAEGFIEEVQQVPTGFKVDYDVAENPDGL